MQRVQATSITSNVIFVGDYNADGSYFDEDLWPTLFDAESAGGGILADTFVQVVENLVDTTVASSSNTYDRAIISVSLHSDSIAAGGGTGVVFAVRVGHCMHSQRQSRLNPLFVRWCA
jgi:hypothetical protein